MQQVTGNKFSLKSAHKCGSSCNHSQSLKAESISNVASNISQTTSHNTSNNKAWLWVGAITTSVAIGAYLINRYGKDDKWSDKVNDKNNTVERSI